MVKSEGEAFIEGFANYDDPKEVAAYVYGYLLTAYPERKNDAALRGLRSQVKVMDTRIAKAFKRGVKDALYDIWDEIRPTREELREHYEYVRRGVLTVEEATLLLRASKDPSQAKGREEVLNLVLAKIRGFAEA